MNRKVRKNMAYESYEKFVKDRGWAFKTEDALKAAYHRLEKSAVGILLTQEEFLTEAGRTGDAKAKEAYDALAALWESKKLTAIDVYQYAHFRWCLSKPEAIIAYQAAHDKWLVNDCGVTASVEKAKQAVHDEFGFEEKLIRIIGTPYYDASDYNFIRFDCVTWSWLMQNGEIYQVYDE